MSTLIKPPPFDYSMSAIENSLELVRLSDINPDMFTNKRPLWHPPGARGIYGGAVIAQCLVAAQHTVEPNYYVHSMHCYFVLAGSSDMPVIYKVERVREGRSFATRTVQAQQRGKAIFTVTLSFMRERAQGEKTVDHNVSLPKVALPEEEGEDLSRGPFESRYVESGDMDDSSPEKKRFKMWLRTRGKISPKGGHEAHLAALAYISDSFFIGTVARAHALWRSVPASRRGKAGDPYKENEEESQKKMQKEEDEADEGVRNRHRFNNGGKDINEDQRPEIGMMVSLDHSIYFHRPREFRADDWMLSEMHTPWSGDNRGVVQQYLWSKDGDLIATCFQEGLVRLKQNPDVRSKM